MRDSHPPFSDPSFTAFPSPVNYYNEFDPKAAAWLSQLISDGVLPPGHVDTRSITEVTPSDLRGFTQCHFFAGIGGWSRALFLAGWPTTEPVWTGSCPCQPFSTAGKQLGTADERHLWPVFYRLIRECRPRFVFGEQVASSSVFGKAGQKDDPEAGPVWIDGVLDDLEAAHYTAGACDLPAAGVGAPNIRQRALWGAYLGVADCCCQGLAERECRGGVQPDAMGAPTREATFSGGHVGGVEITGPQSTGRVLSGPKEGAEPNLCRTSGESGGSGSVGGMDYPNVSRHESPRVGEPEQPERGRGLSSVGRKIGGVGDSDGGRLLLLQKRDSGSIGRVRPPSRPDVGGSGFWDAYDLIPCRDGKVRRIEPGTFPLVNGLPRGMVYGGDQGFPIDPQASSEGRVIRLKGYGNAIVPPLVAEFVAAFLEVLE